ncbi:MAG TPA: hypothetical protein VIB38_07750 [Aestuariivirgaceae bacterium]
MTRAGRLRVLAGLTAITATMAADASAQTCPEWLRWMCPDNASSNEPARKGARTGKPHAQTKARAPEVARRSATPARATTSSGPSNNRHQLQGERQGTPLEPEIDDQQREELFQQFLEWERQTRLNGGTDRRR